MDQSIESMVELMKSDIAGFDFSLSSLSALLPDAQFLWILALLTAFYFLCLWDEARLDHGSDHAHPVDRTQSSAAAGEPIARPAQVKQVEKPE